MLKGIYLLDASAYNKTYSTRERDEITIKNLVVGNVGVNRAVTPLKTTGNKTIRVFE